MIIQYVFKKYMHEKEKLHNQYLFSVEMSELYYSVPQHKREVDIKCAF